MTKDLWNNQRTTTIPLKKPQKEMETEMAEYHQQEQEETRTIQNPPAVPAAPTQTIMTIANATESPDKKEDVKSDS